MKSPENSAELPAPSINASTILLQFIQGKAFTHCGKRHRDFSIDSVSETELGINVTSMSIIPHSNVFDPFSLLGAFQRCPFLSDGTPAPAAFAPRVDWKEAAETHSFKVDLPGLKKEQVKVEVEDGRVLKISGERGGWEEEKGDKWHRVERNRGQFLRRFRLPENAKVDEVKASMEDAVLTITVPKEVKKPQVKAIEISGA